MGNILGVAVAGAHEGGNSNVAAVQQDAERFVHQLRRAAAGQETTKIAVLCWLEACHWAELEQSHRDQRMLAAFELMRQDCHLSGSSALLQRARGALGLTQSAGVDFGLSMDAAHAESCYIAQQTRLLSAAVEDELQQRGPQAGLVRLQVGIRALRIWFGPEDPRVGQLIEPIARHLRLDQALGDAPPASHRGDHAHDAAAPARDTWLPEAAASALGAGDAAGLQAALAQPGLPEQTRVQIQAVWNSKEEKERMWLKQVGRVPFGMSRQDLARLDEGARAARLAAAPHHSFVPEDFEAPKPDSKHGKVMAARAILDRRCITDAKVRESVEIMVNDYYGLSRGSTAVDGSVMCFVGPPGVGKTTLLKDVFEQVLRRPTYTINMDGPSGGERLAGAAGIWRNAQHGRIAQALIETGRMDCMIFIDEIDKISTDGAQTGVGALQTLGLVIDRVRNKNFEDQWFGENVPLDLSQVTFCFAANDLKVLEKVDGLASRIGEAIEFSRPDEATMVQILRGNIVPDFYARHEIAAHQVWLTDAFFQSFMQHHRAQYETGAIRSLKQAMEKILQKVELRRTIEGIALPIALDGALRLDAFPTVYLSGSEPRKRFYATLLHTPDHPRHPGAERLDAFFPDCIAPAAGDPYAAG